MGRKSDPRIKGTEKQQNPSIMDKKKKYTQIRK